MSRQNAATSVLPWGLPTLQLPKPLLTLPQIRDLRGRAAGDGKLRVESGELRINARSAHNSAKPIITCRKAIITDNLPFNASEARPPPKQSALLNFSVFLYQFSIIFKKIRLSGVAIFNNMWYIYSRLLYKHD